MVRDRTAEPDADRYSVCYANAFQTPPGSDEVPPGLLLRGGAGPGARPRRRLVRRLRG